MAQFLQARSALSSRFEQIYARSAVKLLTILLHKPTAPLSQLIAQAIH